MKTLNLILSLILLLGCLSAAEIDDWHIIETIHLYSTDISDLVWSLPMKYESSRLLCYSHQQYTNGRRTKEFINAENNEVVTKFIIPHGHESLVQNRGILRETYTLDGKPVEKLPRGKGIIKYQILDYNRNVISTISFNTPLVHYLGGFDDGRYIGTEFGAKLIHFVHPEKNIYEMIPIDILPRPYNSYFRYTDYSKDIYIHTNNRIHTLIDSVGTLVWQKTTSNAAYFVNSVNSCKSALLENTKNLLDGTVTIFDRGGNKLFSFESEYGAENSFFSSDNKYFFLSENRRNIKIYDAENGSLINTITPPRPGYKSIKEMIYNVELGLLFVLHENTPYSVLSAYNIHDSDTDDPWRINLSKRASSSHRTHLSISEYGNEITVFADGRITFIQINR